MTQEDQPVPSEDLKNIKNLNEDYEAKDRLFYSAMINAWLQTKIERDKQLLTLSSSAIGLLVTLLRTGGVSSWLQIALFSAALFAFLVTVISILIILGKNATRIQEALNGSETRNRALALLDEVATISFIMGMIMVVIIGIYSATSSLGEKGTNMNKDNIGNISRHSVGTNRRDSWNDVHKLRPQPPKVSETNSATPPKASNPSASSGDGGSHGTGKSDASS
jgi:hypothetical protein